jgi:hypothetical protein
MDPFEAFRLYLAIKQHFSSSYDYFKYNGKVSVKRSSFESRNDQYFFSKLAKIPNLLDHLVANLSEKPNIWVKELLEDEAIKKGKYLSKVKQSLTYSFQRDIINLNNEFVENFISRDGDYPELLKLYMQGKIHISTLVILNQCVPFTSRWDRRISDPIVWPNIHKKILKITPFFTFDCHKYMELIQEHFSDTQ